ncbi:hypothetical protein K431DRAFT_287470 [Polychaeton citri CBS 116435]|uniref:Secreted protein n=1 Tax=Polychaeton citri CBS 116435 TaxID=1314669 RepID=A0A9P4Q2Z9_9PEZI|nr:hypothetical protein K431DRAFT_287470 [Polychaeton citri CBS 116435]
MHKRASLSLSLSLFLSLRLALPSPLPSSLCPSSGPLLMASFRARSWSMGKSDTHAFYTGHVNGFMHHCSDRLM